MSTLNLTLSALLIGGGGGGGTGLGFSDGGGGGAGDVVFTSLSITQGQRYNIVVGTGGAGGMSGAGSVGQSSVILNNQIPLVQAIGGGGGGGYNALSGSNGGSGGGGGASISIIGTGGYSTGILGFSGGIGFYSSDAYGGGGGGAGQAGYDASSIAGGGGGFGIVNPVVGSTVGQLSAGQYWIAGGGGGGTSFAGVQLTYGGLGGGGNGAPNSPTSGLSGTGSGGGGAYNSAGGSGGSGAVVLVIATSQYSGITTGSPKVAIVGSNTILTYTSNGTYTAISPPLYTLIQNANAGTVFFDQGFDINKDIVVTFDYACYGSGYTGSEGFSVFFTSTLSGLSGGGPGPGLCYAPVQNVNSVISPALTSFPGVRYGALGIGFDITGNFGTNFYGIDGLSQPVPNSITIRNNFDNNYSFLYNSGNLYSNIFPYPYSIYQQINGSDTPVYNCMRVRLTDFGQRVVIDIKRPTDYLFTNFVSYVLPASTWWPDSVYCGLGFATGQSITNFKIQNLNVNGVFLSSYRTWEYTLEGILDTSIFTSPTTPVSQSVFMHVGDTIAVYTVPTSPLTTISNSVALLTLSADQPLYKLSFPALINVTPGTAGLQSGDEYIIIQ